MGNELKKCNDIRFPMSKFFNEINQIFSKDPFFDVCSLFENDGYGLTNVFEDEDNYYVQISAPGADKDKFDITIENKVLQIKIDIKTEKIEKSNKIHRQEFFSKSISRSMPLPDYVNIENPEATYDNGILTIKFNKTNKEESKKIKIV